MKNIELRKFEDSDLAQIKNWYLNMVEWQLWDAPWEKVEYNENRQKKLEWIGVIMSHVLNLK